MPNKDLISRASVLEALKIKLEEIRKNNRISSELGLRYSHADELNGIQRAISIIESLPQVTDSLSEELESLPREKCECRLELSHVNENENKWFAGYCYNGYTVHEGAWGETPLAAVLALKEALNSKP